MHLRHRQGIGVNAYRPGPPQRRETGPTCPHGQTAMRKKKTPGVRRRPGAFRRGKALWHPHQAEIRETILRSNGEGDFFACSQGTGAGSRSPELPRDAPSHAHHTITHIRKRAKLQAPCGDFVDIFCRRLRVADAKVRNRLCDNQLHARTCPSEQTRIARITGKSPVPAVHLSTGTARHPFCPRPIPRPDFLKPWATVADN